MNASFISAAVESAARTYVVISALPGPEAAAGFGIACGELMQRLNVSLATAAVLLNDHLKRNGIL